MKIAVLLANGFEEIEALTVVDYLKRLDIEVDMVSIEEDLEVKGAHEIEVKANLLVEDLDFKDYKGVVIPGGLPGATNLRDDEKVIEIVKEADKEEKLVAAICAGPIVLEKAGIIKGRKVTSYPGFEEELNSGEYVEDNVVLDGNLLTARGPAIAVEFTLEIAEYLLGKDKRKELEKDILYHMLMG